MSFISPKTAKPKIPFDTLGLKSYDCIKFDGFKINSSGVKNNANPLIDIKMPKNAKKLRNDIRTVGIIKPFKSSDTLLS